MDSDSVLCTAGFMPTRSGSFGGTEDSDYDLLRESETDAASNWERSSQYDIGALRLVHLAFCVHHVENLQPFTKMTISTGTGHL